MKDQEIGIYNPVAGDWVKTRAEAAEERAALAEAEVAQLREQLARLQARS